MSGPASSRIRIRNGSMMKPYTKQRLFCRPSSESGLSKGFSNGEALPLEFLDRCSVFETLRAYRGKIFYWEKHWERLGESCRALNEALPCESEELGAWLGETLLESGHADATLRVSVHWSETGEGRILLF